jgi:hypothetical protein
MDDLKLEVSFLNFFDKKKDELEKCFDLKEAFSLMFKEGYKKGQAEGFAQANRKETPKDEQ